MGNREAHTIALHHAIKTKEELERQKKLMKMHHQAKGKRSSKQLPQQGRKYQRYRGTPLNHGSLGSISDTNSTLVVRNGYQGRSKLVDHHGKRRIGPPGLKRWYNVKPRSPGVATWSIQNPLVLENRHALQDVLQLDNHRNFYRTASSAEELEEQEGEFDDVLHEVHSSFYTLGDFMGPTFVHANSPTDDDSIMEYEEAEESSPFRTRNEVPQFYSSARHAQDLKQV